MRTQCNASRRSIRPLLVVEAHAVPFFPTYTNHILFSVAVSEATSPWAALSTQELWAENLRMDVVANLAVEDATAFGVNGQMPTLYSLLRLISMWILKNYTSIPSRRGCFAVGTVIIDQKVTPSWMVSTFIIIFGWDSKVANLWRRIFGEVEIQEDTQEADYEL